MFKLKLKKKSLKQLSNSAKLGLKQTVYVVGGIEDSQTSKTKLPAKIEA